MTCTLKFTFLGDVTSPGLVEVSRHIRETFCLDLPQDKDCPIPCSRAQKPLIQTDTDQDMTFGSP